MKRSCVSVQRARPLLGTIVQISAEGPDSALLHRAISKAFDAVSQVHALMSFHNQASDLSRLNAQAHLKPVAVHPWTFRVIKTALRISQKTNGYFDCAIGQDLLHLDYLPKRQSHRRAGGNWKDIRLLTGGRVRFRVPMVLDLGGIAKGFAVDRAVVSLRSQGVAAGCVNAGGDLRVFGKKGHKIFVRSPDHPGQFLIAGTLRNKAIATSATYFSKKRWSDQEVSPIINPINRIPFSKRESISVITSSCMIADALTKAVLLDPTHRESHLFQFKARALVAHAR